MSRNSMRAKAWVVFGAWISIAAGPAFAARTILYYEGECCRTIAQGEFAILYCQALGLPEPAQGWTMQTAAAALSTLGHQPEGGWVLSGPLTEGVMSRLLRNSKLNRRPFNQGEFRRSTKPVTIADARTVVPSDEAITQGEFAVLLARALRVPAPGNPSPASAAKLLESRPVPVRPAAGWQLDQPLRETEMLEILGATPFQASSVDPTAGISALQAYSLLFGRFEIATQGHFALYVVEALNIVPPVGGWTMRNALEYVVKEFGLSGGYGMHRNAPLCAGFFVNSLRVILTKTWQPSNARPPTNRISRLLRLFKNVPDPINALDSAGSSSTSNSLEFAPLQETGSSSAGTKDVDNFIQDVRNSGLLPVNRCEPVAAQGFSKAAQGPIGPAQAPVPPPATPPKPASPASSSVPPSFGSRE